MSDPLYPPLPGDAHNFADGTSWTPTEYPQNNGGHPDTSPIYQAPQHHQPSQHHPPPPPPHDYSQTPYHGGTSPGPQTMPYGPPPHMPPQWAPAPKPNRAPLFIAITTAIVVILGIGAWVIVDNLPPDTTETPVTASGPKAETRDGGFVLGEHGPVVDVYLDFACPPCKTFHSTYSSRLAAAVDNGDLTVIYHPIGMIDTRNDGYSSRAAAASACAADEHAFEEYATELFAAQPPEGSGLDNTQLAQIGTDMGLPSSFADCVTAETYLTWVEDQTAETLKSGVGGTPSVDIDGTRVSDYERLDTLLSEIGA